MKTQNVNRSYSEGCEKGFWSKKGALNHEVNCKCWINPKHKTCKTCKFGEKISDSNGMEDDPSFLQIWMAWECHNEKFEYDKHFTEAHKSAPDLCINCPVWVGFETMNRKEMV